MERQPKIVRQGLEKTQKPGDHPDANLLAAFAEKSLTDREGAQVMQHLAECADCRDVISLAMPAVEPAPPIPERSRWLTWPVLRWGALAACVVVVGAAVTLHFGRRDAFAPYSAETPAAPVDLTAETNVPQQPAEKLAEKNAPPSPFQSDRSSGTATGKLSKQLQQPGHSEVAESRAVAPPGQNQNADELLANRLASGKTAKATNSPAKPVAGLVAAAPAAPPPATLPQLELQEKDKSRTDAAAETRIVAAGNIAAPTARTVQPAESNAKAKTSEDDATLNSKSSNNELHKKEAPAARPESQSATSLADRKMDTFSVAKTSSAAAQYEVRSRADNKTASRWTLSGDGQLQRSFDSGKNWQTIPLGNRTVFRALAVNDSDIWVGGEAAVLYHSSDAGQHWAQVKPIANGRSLTGDVVTIEFGDSQHGKLITSNHETWTTDDAGSNWQIR